MQHLQLSHLYCCVHSCGVHLCHHSPLECNVILCYEAIKILPRILKKRHHKLTKKILLQVEGKGKVCQFIPILVKFTFLSNSWLNKLQNMPYRIFYPWTCDWNLIFALSDTELEIFCQENCYSFWWCSFLF